MNSLFDEAQSLERLLLAGEVLHPDYPPVSERRDDRERHILFESAPLCASARDPNRQHLVAKIADIRILNLEARIDLSGVPEEIFSFRRARNSSLQLGELRLELDLGVHELE